MIFARRHLYAALAITASVTVAGCADHNAERTRRQVKTVIIKPAVPVPRRPLDVNNVSGTRWRVVEIDGPLSPKPTRPDSEPPATLLFTIEGRIAGSTSCNDFGGDVRWLPNGQFAQQDRSLIMTVVRCGAGPAEQATTQFGDRFLRMIQQARSWTLEGTQMIIRSQDGSTAKLTALE